MYPKPNTIFILFCHFHLSAPLRNYCCWSPFSGNISFISGNNKDSELWHVQCSILHRTIFFETPCINVSDIKHVWMYPCVRYKTCVRYQTCVDVSMCQISNMCGWINVSAIKNVWMYQRVRYQTCVDVSICQI